MTTEGPIPPVTSLSDAVKSDMDVVSRASVAPRLLARSMREGRRSMAMIWRQPVSFAA